MKRERYSDATSAAVKVEATAVSKGVEFGGRIADNGGMSARVIDNGGSGVKSNENGGQISTGSKV